ncbi:MAG: heme-binding protein [Gammaproteobacteria bacterium]|nr:heme-binding protein [Gammaproteobacteria bacterium]
MSLCITGALALGGAVQADNEHGQGGDSACKSASLPSFTALTNALKSVVALGGGNPNGGFGLNMWASVVDRSGVVCNVTRSGQPGEQWPGSRVISAQKANTANAFSLPGLALSTANLYKAVQPGGSLFGLQESNPVDVNVAYKGPAAKWGTGEDPMRGGRIGGVNVFGGGLALYDKNGVLVGALGVSGDSSCADHAIAWRLRHALNLDNIPGGVVGGTDNLTYDSTNGFSQALCGADPNEAAIAANLPIAYPVGPAP